MKILQDDMMTRIEFNEFIKNKSKEYEGFELLSDIEKQDYYNKLETEYADLLGKACCDCAYASENNGIFYCNFGDSDNYGKEITGRNYCDEFEEI